MVQPDVKWPLRSKLYKDYFDDPTLSDLTIRLSDRTVYTHRIVLCRGSEYFTKLLTGSFRVRQEWRIREKISHTKFCEQERGSKEVELHEDDPQAMIALLRFLYDLPYGKATTEQWDRTLKPHAKLYVVADKYRVEALKSQVYRDMQIIIKSKHYLKNTVKAERVTLDDRLQNKDDFADAVQIIYGGTTIKDIQRRKLIVDFLVQNIDLVRKDRKLLSLIKIYPDLGADIIEHPDLTSETTGNWYCVDDQCEKCLPSCEDCKTIYGSYDLSRNRWRTRRLCPECWVNGYIICSNCGTRTWWQGNSGLWLEPKP